MKRQIGAGAYLINLFSISCSWASFINFVLEFFRVNQALQFDGVDDHVLLPPIQSLGLTDRYFPKSDAVMLLADWFMFLCCLLFLGIGRDFKRRNHVLQLLFMLTH